VKDVRTAPERAVQAFYTVEINDWAAVIAVLEDGRIPLIRQYRPAVERFLCEFPAGAVRGGESPDEVARRELREEAGCEADELVPLGAVYPEGGRLTSRAWTYFAPAARVVSAPEPHPDEDLELVFVRPEELRALMDGGEFASAGHLAAVALALVRNELSL
jgi:ADP-ribose pyrophosphatase